MLTVAVHCARRLVAARRWQRPTELDTDGGHVLMGVAMAGMLVARLRIMPAAAWEECSAMLYILVLPPSRASRGTAA
jgi:hypothetical protein